ncbi:hypothetical protein Baya_10323 [Bagarius yarrelli]|uniref:Uncharacterized protein n=1 Tax=Bagarius yarrelli TaxID=175774 RepID=A0A556UYQ4_BAGYA|nr:hypothetical protein Baya_10323 [Bagarius yarrelli]
MERKVDELLESERGYGPDRPGQKEDEQKSSFERHEPIKTSCVFGTLKMNRNICSPLTIHDYIIARTCRTDVYAVQSWGETTKPVPID